MARAKEQKGRKEEDDQRRQNHCRRADRIDICDIRRRLHEPSSATDLFGSVYGGDGDRKKDGPVMPEQTRARR